MTQPLRVLMLASEMIPYAKTGGLADVVGALPAALRGLGHEVIVALPRYRGIDPGRYPMKRIGEVQVPLGGRAGGFPRQAAVLLLVMALAGLWHGANWTFVAWGVLWGVYIVLWRLAAPALARVPRGLRWTGHLAVVMTLWVFFRSPDIGFAGRYIARMYSFDLPSTASASTVWAVIGCALLLVLHRMESYTHGRGAVLWIRRHRGPLLVGLLSGLCVLLLLFPNDDINPFIYFRF